MQKSATSHRTRADYFAARRICPHCDNTEPSGRRSGPCSCGRRHRRARRLMRTALHVLATTGEAP